MTPQRLTEINSWSQREFVPGSNLHEAAAMLRELLAEREHMREAAATTCRELFMVGDAECVEIGERLDAAMGAA